MCSCLCQLIIVLPDFTFMATCVVVIISNCIACVSYLLCGFVFPAYLDFQVCNWVSLIILLHGLKNGVVEVYFAMSF